MLLELPFYFKRLRFWLKCNEIYKVIKFDQIRIECEEKQILALPSGNNNQQSDNDCSMNCPVCGTINILNEANTEFKCVYCESPLF